MILDFFRRNDIQKHTIYSAFLSGVATSLVIMLGSHFGYYVDVRQAKITGVLIGGIGTFLVVTLYKEIGHDLIKGKGMFQWSDILANLIGCTTGAVGIGLIYE